ncbi:MAG: Sec-independent protein translocase protein TatB [Paracoccaceae bacterium]|jgi:sec-independent protein translocase protein TatB
MFDIGFSELMVIGVVSLIVVGPKDLPGMFRTVGRYVGKAKSMAREFQRSMEDAADASGMSDITADFKNMASGLDDVKDIMNPVGAGTKKVKDKFNKILDAKDTGVPLRDEDEDPEAAADKEFATDLVDDDPDTAIVEIVEDAPKPKAKSKGKAAAKPKAKTAAKPKAKATAKPKAAAIPKTAAKPKPKPKAKPKAKSISSESSQT